MSALVEPSPIRSQDANTKDNAESMIDARASTLDDKIAELEKRILRASSGNSYHSDGGNASPLTHLYLEYGDSEESTWMHAYLVETLEELTRLRAEHNILRIGESSPTSPPRKRKTID